MKNKSGFLALTLALFVGAASIAAHACDAKAAGAMEQIQRQEIAPEETEPAVIETKLPAEDGEYVVYMENDIMDEVSIDDEAYELAADSPAVILETNLSAAQLEQLEELSGQEEDIYVEENIFFTGASYGNTSEETGIEETDIEEIDTEREDVEETDIERVDIGETEDADEEDADLAERQALKRELVKQFISDGEEDEEAEWNIQMIHADDVNAEVSGTPVKVAVLDSGVEFLAGIPVAKSINFVKDEQDLPYYMNDMTGHGTAIADIIYQVCPQARIYSVKVMDSENRGRLSDVVAGIYWCIEQEVDIINMSFGTNVESDILREAVGAAAEHGIMMISSAGNGGAGSEVEYPAAFAEVIAVGAVDTSAQKTGESAAGEEVELAAPGEQILTKSMLGLETVNSGTSMAAPHVTGAAALLMQQSECKDADVIRRALDKSSNPLGDEDAYGYGLVDVAYAAELLSGYKEIVKEEHADGDAADDFDGAETVCFQWGEDKTCSQEACDSGDHAIEKTPGEVAQNSLEEPEAEIKLESGKEMETDAIDAAEQVRRPVETFEEVDYVEGRWSKDMHRVLAGEAEYDGSGLTKIQIDIFKTGAAFPDYETETVGGFKHGSVFPEWHGWYGWKTENYIANFLFATKIAKAGGNTTKLTKVNGQKDAVYQRMKACISEEGINGKKWGTLIEDYNSQNEKTQKKWRRAFLYGMALHTATDAFAHASCYKDETTGKLSLCVDSGKDDRPGFVGNRWECAKNTAYFIAIDCELNIEGDIIDFSSNGFDCWKGFYMAHILEYAEAVNGGKDKELTAEFKAVDCANPPQRGQ